jgi:hypothetical protein
MGILTPYMLRLRMCGILPLVPLYALLEKYLTIARKLVLLAYVGDVLDFEVEKEAKAEMKF